MLYKWEARYLQIFRDRDQATKNFSSKTIKPIIAQVLFANSGKIAELEIFNPDFGSPFYIVDLPSGECMRQAVRGVNGEGYDFIDILSSERVARDSNCN